MTDFTRLTLTFALATLILSLSGCDSEPKLKRSFFDACPLAATSPEQAEKAHMRGCRQSKVAALAAYNGEGAEDPGYRVHQVIAAGREAAYYSRVSQTRKDGLQVSIARTSHDESSEWISSPDVPLTFTTLENGDIIACGAEEREDGKLIFIRFSPSGKQILRKHIEFGNDIEYCLEIKELPDGSILMTGDQRSKNRRGSVIGQTWILKTDQDGEVKLQHAYEDGVLIDPLPDAYGGLWFGGSRKISHNVSQGHVLRIASDGTPQWEWPVGAAENSAARLLKIDGDEGPVTLSVKSEEDTFDTIIRIGRYSVDGERISQANIRIGYKFSVLETAAAPDETILVLMSTSSSDRNVDRFRMTSYDFDGNELWAEDIIDLPKNYRIRTHIDSNQLTLISGDTFLTAQIFPTLED